MATAIKYKAIRFNSWELLVIEHALILYRDSGAPHFTSIQQLIKRIVDIEPLKGKE